MHDTNRRLVLAERGWRDDEIEELTSPAVTEEQRRLAAELLAQMRKHDVELPR